MGTTLQIVGEALCEAIDLRSFAALTPEGQGALAADLGALGERFNVARDGTMVVPSAYLEAVIARE